MRKLILLFTGLVTNIIWSQDAVFTQFFLVPQTINPGFTGYMETINAGALHRTQWPDLGLRIDSDYAFFNIWEKSMNSGFGVNLLSHRESFTNYSFSQADFNYVYKVELTDEWYFRPSIQVAYANKSYGFSNIVFQDQLNIDTETINPNSIDPIQFQERRGYVDFTSGLLFNNETTWVGVCFKHLNRPNISFVNRGNQTIEPLYSFTFGKEFNLSLLFNSPLIPSDSKLLFVSNFMKQGEFNRLDFGTIFVIEKVFFGTTLTSNPIRNSTNSHYITSTNFIAGLQYEHFKVGLSYDHNISSIGKTGGIYELSFLYQFDINAPCFGCPTYK